MSLKEKLQEDLKSSMKNKDTVKKSVVTLIRASIKQYEVDNRVELEDDAIIDLIAKQLKQRRDSLVEFEKANRDDLVSETEAEIEVLKEYLPQQLSEEELNEIVKATISEVGATSMKDMGKIMAAIKPKTKGRADGKLINELVKNNLQQIKSLEIFQAFLRIKKLLSRWFINRFIDMSFQKKEFFICYIEYINLIIKRGPWTYLLSKICQKRWEDFDYINKGNKKFSYKYINTHISSYCSSTIANLLARIDANTYYSQLIKPGFAPPSFIFPIVWVILYTLMGISAYKIMKKGYDLYKVRDAMFYYWLQLFLNFIWSILFFGLDLRFTGLVVIIILIIIVSVMVYKFSKINKFSSYINIPYIVWLLYALFLNYFIWIINK